MPSASPVSRERAVLLGPHPGNGMFSISNYFNFCRRALADRLPEFDIEAEFPGDRNGFDREVLLWSGRISSWWQNYIEWPWKLRALRADLFHIVDQGLAWYSRYLNSGARLITVHDLIAYLTWTGKLDLERLSTRRVLLLKENIAEVKQADCIISVSDHTADCLVRELDVSPRKIHVIHNSVGESFRPLTCSERAAAREKFFGSAEHVIIHVGKPLSYKNRIGALRAFALLHKAIPGAEMFFTSDPATPEESSFMRESGCLNAFHFTKPLSNPQLREFYAAADVLIFPSRYEGFGWPPVEAMACGCPVVSTTCGSLREIVGDAALTVTDPDDFEGMATQLRAVITDASMADHLRSLGFQRVKKFTPEVATEKLADVYRSLLMH